MNTEIRTITIGGLPVDVVRKAIKNLHLAVYPPDGRVRVAVPWHVSEDAVRLAVTTRLAWIMRQRGKFQAQARQSMRDYVSGETHYFLGRSYRLRVNCEAQAFRIRLAGGAMIEMLAPADAGREARERAMQRWYRRELRRRAQPLVERWSRRLGIEPPVLGIKRMRTKWGTCNATGRRVWLNLEMAKKPPHCIDYIVVHELAHFHHRTHGEEFVELMNRHLPNWRALRDELNAQPLAYEAWDEVPPERRVDMTVVATE